MAIYKLGEIGSFKGGISTLDKNKYDSGIVFINYMDVFKNEIIRDISGLRLYDASENDYKKHNIAYGDAMFTASSEKPEEIAMSSVFLSKEKAILNGFCKRFRFNHEILIPEFAAYLFRSDNFRKNAQIFATGYTRYNISQGDLSKIEINIPEIDEQLKIIDIIEQNEQLFLKYSNTVRIDSVKNCEDDFKKLIDIIEPIEELESIINSTIKKIKLILKHNYELIVGDSVDFYSKIKLINSKYNNQLEYVATNAINEFGIDAEKIQSLDISIPSRANVSPTADSFIISKLDGENKVFYFNEKPNEVYSTGFFNFETNYVDHISGFLLSNSFIKQKEMYSTGTTMRGLNNKSLETIKIKNSSNESNELTKYLTNLNDLQSKVIKIKNEIIKLLIK